MNPRAADAHRLTVLVSPLLEAPGRVHGFTTRQGGASKGPFAGLDLGRGCGDSPDDVALNQALLLEHLGLPRHRIAAPTQVHGRRVVRVDAPPDRPFAPVEADGLISDIPGWLLGVRTADCVPILVASEHVVAAFHAGWRGTVAGIALAVVEQFDTMFGVPPERLVAAIGPAIGPECYEVGVEVVSGLEAVMKDCARGTLGVVFRESGAGGERFRVDLKEANRSQLEQAGVPGRAIDVLPYCVHCRADLFFSHRRDRGTTGRMMNVIGLT